MGFLKNDYGFLANAAIVTAKDLARRTVEAQRTPSAGSMSAMAINEMVRRRVGLRPGSLHQEDHRNARHIYRYRSGQNHLSPGCIGRAVLGKQKRTLSGTSASQTPKLELCSHSLPRYWQRARPLEWTEPRDSVRSSSARVLMQNQTPWSLRWFPKQRW